MAGVTVEKRGKTWRYRFDAAPINGKRNRPSKGGFATRKEALAAGNAALAEYNNTGLTFSPKEISFADYLSFWLTDYCSVNLKAGSINEYEGKIRRYIAPKLGGFYLNKITPSIIQSLINEMFNAGYSRNVIKQTRGIIFSALAYAVEPLNFIKENPAMLTRMPRRAAKPKVATRSNPHIYVTEDQIKKIFERFPEKKSAHIPLLLGYTCGLRAGEVFGLTIHDIDFDEKKIHIRRQMQRDIKRKLWYISEPKYESVRTIEVDDDTLAVLERRVQEIKNIREKLGDQFKQYYVDGDGVITTTQDGNQLIEFLNVTRSGETIFLSSIRHTVDVIQRELKIKEFDFHSLRHTHATKLIEQRAPLKFVQERLGHKTSDITLRIYQHVSDGVSEIGRDVLNQAFTSRIAR